MGYPKHPAELFRRCFYIGASLPSASRGTATAAAVFARAQALLSLRMLAYGLLDVLRAQMEAATGHGWSLRRLRQRVLRAADRLQRHVRRLHVILKRRAARLWRQLLGRRHLQRVVA